MRAVQDLAEQLEVVLHLPKDPLRVASTVTAGVPLEDRLQVGDVGGVAGPRESSVDALVCLSESCQCSCAGHGEHPGDEYASFHGRYLLAVLPCRHLLLQPVRLRDGPGADDLRDGDAEHLFNTAVVSLGWEPDFEFPSLEVVRVEVFAEYLGDAQNHLFASQIRLITAAAQQVPYPVRCHHPPAPKRRRRARVGLRPAPGCQEIGTACGTGDLPRRGVD